jgi:alpha-D-ribose 1-methylphosphonate 5-triphosphate synthase subunit PhnG
MNTVRRYEALSIAELGDIEMLADQILGTGTSVNVLSGPEVVSAPIRYPVPGTQQTTTVLGHVALTMCAVELDGVRGDGIRTCRDLVGAVAAAVCDAEAERNGPLSNEVLDLCDAALLRQEAEARSRASLVSATRLETSG